MKKALLFSILVLCATALHANDGAYGIRGEGGAVIPIKNNAITMREEQIDIDVYQVDSINFRIDYTCKFYFENSTNRVQDVLVGFPHLLDASKVPNYTGNGPSMVRNPGGPAVSDFVFNVGGKRVDWDVFPAEQNPSLSNVPPYDVIYAVNVGFAPGKKKLISNTYSINRRHSEHEGEANSPCYYIAYNLACVFTRMSSLADAQRWLSIAYRMKPDLSELA
jgi:hypothetical protein